MMFFKSCTNLANLIFRYKSFLIFSVKHYTHIKFFLKMNVDMTFMGELREQVPMIPNWSNNESIANSVICC